MRFRLLNSSWLDSVAYDPLMCAMTVRYKSGQMYRYLRVPARVYFGLLAAESPGAFFNEWVRDRGYPCRKIC